MIEGKAFFFSSQQRSRDVKIHTAVNTDARGREFDHEVRTASGGSSGKEEDDKWMGEFSYKLAVNIERR